MTIDNMLQFLKLECQYGLKQLILPPILAKSQILWRNKTKKYQTAISIQIKSYCAITIYTKPCRMYVGLRC